MTSIVRSGHRDTVAVDSGSGVAQRRVARASHCASLLQWQVGSANLKSLSDRRGRGHGPGPPAGRRVLEKP